jgi:hypothetical protein
MIRKLTALLIWASVRVIMTSPLYAQQITPPMQMTNTERMNLAAGGTIRIDHSWGDLSIEGWDQPEMEITVIKSMPYDYKLKQPHEATEHLNGVQVVTKRISDDEVMISTAKTKGDVMIEYRIHAPRDSKLVIHHGAGSVSVSDMAGDIEASGSRGDIMLMVPRQFTYAVDAQTKLGTIVSEFDGDSRKHHLVGRSFTRSNASASRIMRLRMGYGGITIKALPDRTVD